MHRCMWFGRQTNQCAMCHHLEEQAAKYKILNTKPTMDAGCTVRLSQVLCTVQRKTHTLLIIENFKLQQSALLQIKACACNQMDP